MRKHSDLYWILVIAIIVLAVGAYFLLPMYFQSTYPCTTKKCFTERSQACIPAKIALKDTAGNRVSYIQENCILTKKFKSFNKDEPEEIVYALQNRTMECRYDAGEFNEEFLDGITGGIEDCEGDMRDMIEQLILATGGGR